MAQHYFYKAMDTHGRTIQGYIDANNISDLEARLDRMGLDLISYKLKTTRQWYGGRVSRLELITFCFHLEQLTRAGVPLIVGLCDLRDSLTPSRFRDVITNLIESIEGGEQLSEAMRHYPDVFNTVFVNLVRAGEESGHLSSVFLHLSEGLKWEDELASRMKKIIMYPLIVGGTIMAAVFFLMIYLVPQLISFLKNLGKELPFQTKLLLMISDTFVNYWMWLISFPVLIVALVIIGVKMSPSFRYSLDRIKLKLWFIGPLMEKLILARFATFFGLLYGAGVTVLDALEITSALSGNKVIEEALLKVKEQISEGVGISESFEKIKLFPPLVLRMVKIGETTGELEKSLFNISYFYNREVKESIEKLQTMIEPTLTVVLGGILLWIMMAVLGPVYDSIGEFVSKG